MTERFLAARLEAKADPGGGICISKTAFDHIQTKLSLGYEFLGKKEVKNMREDKDQQHQLIISC
jgi:class 3 adenylate cyclase